MSSIEFNCKELSTNPDNKLESGELKAEIYHKSGDPENVNRIRLETMYAEVEILPSKGLSVGEAFFNGKAVFWEPPIGMPNPDTLDLWSDEVAINGKPAPGFTFLKTFNGGIELYGLKNWGMPVKKDGTLQLLHGETSNIPVENVELQIQDKDKIILTGSFLYKTWKGDSSLPWYQRGANLCLVKRKVILLNNEAPEIEIYDEFKNISNSDFFVDWGYHITFRPEEGGKIIVPANKMANRFGGSLPTNFDTWKPAENQYIRTESGIIYKETIKHKVRNRQNVNILIKRPNLGNLLLTAPAAPYTQAWMCSGGADSNEFTSTKTGQPLFKKNWDGMGIEIGASALDHDQNTDPEVPLIPTLYPGQKTSVQILVKSV